MSKYSIPQFIGVIISFLIIWLINDVILVDGCTEQGGVFSYKTGKCLLANNEVYTADFTNYLMALYFFIGIVVAVTTSRLIKKIFKITP
ncbi:hypothetical protein Q4530_05350 [Colwellia sp. 1_MG-2023]|uniref:hypothetical protein n=1 Tax=unclassified Colwellia TaxID=196834 RepID=UPI001C08FE75|nr:MULTISPECIES: hypothetical protein [unclassified Colwellia]MBU2924098.1 hypothetical protein [Colwellia sp. C2M11]MDO6651989.1 hypothetical protein [Colwellia sp. 3_MG-2023]MDO6664765.1 hypothetical protein [Colwellia sp. 2_MG-2023]MDO6689193.1 hypothetical protein [Colwellia sp. 1_MG-2023]